MKGVRSLLPHLPSTPLSALLVSIFGVAFAWFFLLGGWLIIIPIGVATVICLTGWMSDRIGRASLPAHPVRAVRWLEGWSLIPASVAMVAAGIIIVIVLKLAVPQHASAEQRELTGALAAAVTTYLSTTFVTGVPTADDRVKHVFQEAYSYLPKGGAADVLVQSDFARGCRGWGYSARRKRAEGLQERLESGEISANAHP